jgi:type I restriction enzyme, R subunit
MIKDYNGTFGTNFSTDTFDGYYKDIANKVKEKKIDILLVVNMFLTGFDSKYLNTLYVDKNLKYHGLLQAYSRTNRILDEAKQHGNIVNFRNLKARTDESIALFSNEDTSAIDSVIMKSFNEYLEDFNKVFDVLIEIAPTVQSIDDLQDEQAEYNFVQAFREVLRIYTRLKGFTDFNFETMPLTEQELNDYQSKYLDIYEKVKGNTSKEKVSILDDIDFEIELMRTDKINVMYILTLLKDLDLTSPAFEKDKEFILKSIDTTPDLKSKKELFEKFINENLNIGTQSDIENDILDFFDKEREREIDLLIEKENLEKEKIKAFINDYEFSNKYRDEYIKESLVEKLGLLQRKKKVELIKQNLVNILSKFKLNLY